MIGDKERSQLDMYDIFGYLVPGFIFCVAVVVAIVYWHGIEFGEIAGHVDELKASRFFTMAIMGLTASYIVGHMIATLSEVIFDRIFVQKIFGYPFQNLLFGRYKKGSPKYFRREITANFYRTAVTIIHAFGCILIFYPLIKLPFKEDVFFALLLMFFTLIPLKWIERWGSGFNWSSVKIRFGKFWLLFVPLHWAQFIFARFLWFTALPFRVAESLIRGALGLDTRLSDDLIKKIESKFYREFKINLDGKLASDIYWLIYWYVAENSVHMRDRLYKFLSLYGLARNTSVALFLSAMVISMPSYFHEHRAGFHFIVFSAVLLLSSVIMSIRYYYLYYNYYSKSLFRSFVVLRGP